MSSLTPCPRHRHGRRLLAALAIPLALTLGGCTASGQPTSPGATTSAADTASTQFSLNVSNQTVTVAGSVPDEATKASVVQALQQGVGAGTTVTDKLNVAPGSTLPSGQALTTLASALAPVEALNLNVSGTKALIAGNVSTEDEKNAAADAVKAAFTGAEVENSISVVPVCSVKGAKVRELSKPPAIVFDSGSAQLSDQANAAIQQIAGVVKQCEGTKLTVVGQTDKRGSEAGNENLGLQRARAVRDKLVADGVPSDAIIVQGNAANAPVSSENSLNRRVDVAVQ
ncbi:OmpA family protein [Nigerium sp.]|uniref:channel-forming protein ArfA/OmpATb n=1 Tax=Nigerium sp. TaxID=2042655 RepID=UPI003221524A